MSPRLRLNYRVTMKTCTESDRLAEQVLEMVRATDGAGIESVVQHNSTESPYGVRTLETKRRRV